VGAENRYFVPIKHDESLILQGVDDFLLAAVRLYGLPARGNSAIGL
jgi:hypothetical protein